MLLLAKGFDGLLLNLLLHDLCSLLDRPSSGHVLPYLVKAFILLVKARQLIFNNSFDFFLGILLLTPLSFTLLL
jgi:hypothetical protein